MGKKIPIDATGVDPEIRKQGKAVRVPEGDYLVKVVNHELLDNKAGDAKYIKWECQIVKPPEYKGKTLRGNTSLKRDALWSLRNLIFAAVGKNIAGKSVKFDPETIYGKVVGAAVSDNEYEKDGKTRISSQIDSFFPKAEFGKEEEEDEDDEEEVEEDEDEEEEDDELEDVDVEDI